MNYHLKHQICYQGNGVSGHYFSYSFVNKVIYEINDNLVRTCIIGKQSYCVNCKYSIYLSKPMFSLYEKEKLVRTSKAYYELQDYEDSWCFRCFPKRENR